jgi:hypothetical protein
MSESKTPTPQCPVCFNFDNHQEGCRIGTLELELNEALASLPLVDNRVRNEAEKLLAQTLRHDDGNGASHGCVEVTGVKLRFELLIAQANQLRSQLTTAQQEIADLKRDKERLDWLERSHTFDGGMLWAKVGGLKGVQCSTLRQAIDSVIAKETKE